jgi:hypothetical protein
MTSAGAQTSCVPAFQFNLMLTNTSAVGDFGTILRTVTGGE